MTKTITRLFDSYTDAEAAVADLEAHGMPPGDISLIANNADAAHAHAHLNGHEALENAGEVSGSGAAMGGVAGGAVGLLAGLGLLAVPGLGPVVAAGWLASTVVGLVAGIGVGGVAGGLVGALTGAGVPDSDAQVYAEGVRRGGTLVSIRAPDDLAAMAELTLLRFNPVDTDARGRAYRADGWAGFDPDAKPYAPGVRDRAARL